SVSGVRGEVRHAPGLLVPAGGVCCELTPSRPFADSLLKLNHTIGSQKASHRKDWTGMSHFPLHTITSAPEQAKPILGQLQERVGFVPNLAATMADNPLVLESYVTLGAIFGRGSFSPAEQQFILMATGFGNQCTYCMAAHSTFAKALGASDADRE